MTEPTRLFAGDNCAPVDSRIMDALQQANAGHVQSYGADRLTEHAVAVIHDLFERDCAVFFVYNGTAANVLSATVALQPYEAIICTEQAHLFEDETGAPEAVWGGKLLAVPTHDAKLRPEHIEPHLDALGSEHRSQPAMVSLTQSNELGIRYSIAEIEAVVDAAHRHGLLVHIDGARIANAVAGEILDSLDAPDAPVGNGDVERLLPQARAVLRRTVAGADVLSLGATKNGLMFGEAVVFFGDAAVKARRHAKFLRKRALQLHSKMRFVSAQFAAMFESAIWLENAVRANQMARRLGRGLAALPQYAVAYPVQANAVFVRAPRAALLRQQAFRHFYLWDETNRLRPLARLMTAFDTRAEDIDAFVAHAAATV